MTDKEKIIAEIKRLKSCKSNLEEDTEYLRGYDFAIETLEEFINSLPDEKPSEDLNKEIDRFIADKVGKTITVGQVAHYFANWRKQQMMKSAIDAIITSRWKDSHVCLTTNKDIPQIYNGDRVKVIIVKEDEQ